MRHQDVYCLFCSHFFRLGSDVEETKEPQKNLQMMPHDEMSYRDHAMPEVDVEFFYTDDLKMRGKIKLRRIIRWVIQCWKYSSQ